MSEAESVARALGGQRAGRGWVAFCPAHDNTRTPALSISEGRDGRLLVKCHAGCAGDRQCRGSGVVMRRTEGDPATPGPLPAKRAGDALGLAHRAPPPGISDVEETVRSSIQVSTSVRR